jgi:hypothetical protein
MDVYKKIAIANAIATGDNTSLKKLVAEIGGTQQAYDYLFKILSQTTKGEPDKIEALTTLLMGIKGALARIRQENGQEILSQIL